MQQNSDEIGIKVEENEEEKSREEKTNTLSSNTHLKERRMLFDSNAVMSKMLVNVTVVMTFGLASPLLAVTVALDCVVMLLLWRVLWGRYLSMCTEAGVEAEAVSRLQVAMHQASRGVGRGVWMAVCMSGVFWAIFIFDMMADVFGNVVGGGMVVVPVVGLPLVMWCACVVLSVVSDKQGSLRKEEREEGVELTSVSNPIILSQVSNSTF